MNSTTRRPHTFGLVRAWVSILALGACSGCADVTTTPVSATYADGYAAPGEPAQIVFHTRRSLSGHLHRVTVAGGELLPVGTVLYDENSEGYGMYLETPTRLGLMDMLRHFFVGDPMHPQTTVEIPVLAETAHRGRTSLELRVQCSRAVSSGIDNFATESPEVDMSVPITVVSPGREWLIRLRDVAGRFLLGAALLWIGITLSESKRGPLNRVPQVLRFACAAGVLYAVFVFSSDPLCANLGSVQTGYRALILLGCFFGWAVLLDRVEALLKKHKPDAAATTTQSAR